MNKWIAIPIIGVLAVGLIATGVFYLQGTNKLEDAQSEIAALEGNVSGLETDLAATETDLAATETDLAATETDLVASEATNSTLEVELAGSAARVATLETQLDEANSATQTQQNRILTLSEELDKVKDPRHFESVEELEAWLAQDDTDTRIRWASMPLYERAFVLQVRALRDGYLLPAWFFDPDLAFIGNLAYIGDEIWWVWPDDDSIELMLFLIPLIPSYPLSLDEDS